MFGIAVTPVLLLFVCGVPVVAAVIGFVVWKSMHKNGKHHD